MPSLAHAGLRTHFLSLSSSNHLTSNPIDQPNLMPNLSSILPTCAAGQRCSVPANLTSNLIDQPNFLEGFSSDEEESAQPRKQLQCEVREQIER